VANVSRWPECSPSLRARPAGKPSTATPSDKPGNTTNAPKPPPSKQPHRRCWAHATAQQAFILLDLGELTAADAIEHLTDALPRLPASFVRARTSVLVDLAHATAGDRDAGAGPPRASTYRVACRALVVHPDPPQLAAIWSVAATALRMVSTSALATDGKGSSVFGRHNV
jgi:hypothetical protein